MSIETRDTLGPLLVSTEELLLILTLLQSGPLPGMSPRLYENLAPEQLSMCLDAVSYTHLDVYKRQLVKLAAMKNRVSYLSLIHI